MGEKTAPAATPADLSHVKALRDALEHGAPPTLNHMADPTSST